MTTDNEQEKLMVLDEDGNSTGEIKTRKYIHENMLYHNEVRIFILNGKNILLEKRSKNKKYNPEKYCVPGGHVPYNETILKCAINEVYEEIGLKLNPNDIHYIMKFKQIKKDQKCFKNNFYAFTDKPLDYFKKQDSEVDELVYISFEKFMNMIKGNDNYTTYDYKLEKELFDKLEKIVKEGV